MVEAIRDQWVIVAATVVVAYRECGVLRRSAFFAGQWHDEWLSEILREG